MKILFITWNKIKQFETKISERVNKRKGEMLASHLIETGPSQCRSSTSWSCRVLHQSRAHDPLSLSLLLSFLSGLCKYVGHVWNFLLEEKVHRTDTLSHLQTSPEWTLLPQLSQTHTLNKSLRRFIIRINDSGCVRLCICVCTLEKYIYHALKKKVYGGCQRDTKCAMICLIWIVLLYMLSGSKCW